MSSAVMLKALYDAYDVKIEGYEYDAENNRIAVTTGARRTEYVINTQPELSQILQSKTYEVDKEDTAKTTYYYYGKGLLAQENSNGYLTYHFNNVGSTMVVTDADGEVTAKYNYSPYGELLEGEYNTNIPFLYNGQFGVMTDGNGLYYMRARYYNVDIKRFINQDVLIGTLERISSLNRFAYVEGNPVSFLDPFGLERSIYDDWHDYLQEMMTFYTIVSMAITTLTSPLPENVKNSKPALAVAIALLIDVLWVASMDIGVCIGRAWEGVLESDYNKIDTSYRMMGEVLDSVVLAISTYLLDDWCDTDVFGYLEGISSLLQTYGR